MCSKRLKDKLIRLENKTLFDMEHKENASEIQTSISFIYYFWQNSLFTVATLPFILQRPTARRNLNLFFISPKRLIHRHIYLHTLVI